MQDNHQHIMSVADHLRRLQQDKAKGKKLSIAELQSETQRIINAARTESVPHFVRLNAFFPLVNEAAKEAKRIKDTCDHCADLLRTMLDQDVKAE